MKTLIEIINEKIGTDATPNNLAPNALACAETVSTILREYLAQKGIDFPVIIGTPQLYQKMLSMRDVFEQVYEPQAGYIIINPSTPSVHGHCGFFVDETNIVSNTSLEPNVGHLIQNYTRTTWRNYFHYYLGLPSYLFSLKV
jgi:hypothetical protein